MFLGTRRCIHFEHWYSGAASHLSINAPILVPLCDSTASFNFYNNKQIHIYIHIHFFKNYFIMPYRLNIRTDGVSLAGKQHFQISFLLLSLILWFPFGELLSLPLTQWCELLVQLLMKSPSPNLILGIFNAIPPKALRHSSLFLPNLSCLFFFILSLLTCPTLYLSVKSLLFSS